MVADVLDQHEVKALLYALSSVNDQSAVRRRSGVYAIRNLLRVVPQVGALSRSARLIGLAHDVLGPAAMPVKATLFDKTPEANWLVPWHQDLTICVNSRVDADGYGPWTIKAGIMNVQPPVVVLERMLTIRLHLDTCNKENGALRVLPGSHKLGRLSADQIRTLEGEITPTICEVESGSAVLMRPLLLHASSLASDPRHRRVIHIDFAAADLPPGLLWHSD